MFIDLILQCKTFKNIDEKESFEYENIQETKEKIKNLLCDQNKNLVDDLCFYLHEHWDYLHFLEYDKYIKLAFITGIEIGEFKFDHENQ